MVSQIRQSLDPNRKVYFKSYQNKHNGIWGYGIRDHETGEHVATGPFKFHSEAKAREHAELYHRLADE